MLGPFVRNNSVVGNTIVRNGRSGVLIQKGANNNRIGGTNVEARNVISGNTVFGIEINTPIDDSPFVATSRNTIQGNFIGTDLTGTTAIPNIGDGIRAMLTARMAQSGAITLLEREKIDQVMKEQDFAASNRVRQSDECPRASLPRS